MGGGQFDASDLKKIIFSVLALLMGAGALTGCSSCLSPLPRSPANGGTRFVSNCVR